MSEKMEGIMKVVRILSIVVLALMVMGLVLGTACAASEQSPQTDTTEDAEFISWVGTTCNQFEIYLNDVNNAATSWDFSTLESIGQTQEILIDETYIPQCRSFHVSATWEPLRTEFRACLNDHSWAAFYINSAGTYLQENPLSVIGLDHLEQATSYLEQANAHLSVCMQLVEQA